jgi:hypothetical protein
MNLTPKTELNAAAQEVIAAINKRISSLRKSQPKMRKPKAQPKVVAQAQALATIAPQLQEIYAAATADFKATMAERTKEECQVPFGADDVCGLSSASPVHSNPQGHKYMPKPAEVTKTILNLDLSAVEKRVMDSMSPKPKQHKKSKHSKGKPQQHASGPRKNLVVRVEGKAGMFSIGEALELAQGCAFFQRGDYDMPRNQAETVAKMRGASFPYVSLADRTPAVSKKDRLDAIREIPSVEGRWMTLPEFMQGRA